MIQITGDDTFRADVEELASPALVHFTAEWCGPCRDLTRQLEVLDDEMANRLMIFRIDIDENPKIAAKYGVRALPTCFLFRDAQVVARKLGGAAASDLLEWLRREL